MHTGWWYRASSAIGTTLLAMAVGVASLYATRIGSHPQPVDGIDILLAMMVTGLAVGFALVPMYQPRPRRVTSMLGTTIARIAVACVVIAVVGTLFASPALTPTSAIFTGVILSAVLPVYYWTLRRNADPERILVLGDDRSLIEEVTNDLPVEPLGLVSPSMQNVLNTENRTAGKDQWPTSKGAATADGGKTSRPPNTETSGPVDGIDRLGGLLRLESLLVKYDIDTVALAFTNPDRGDFFGSLAVAHDYGVDVLAHESHAECVIVDDEREGSIIAVEVDPWRWYSHVVKRTFDVVFAVVGLVALVPLAVGITGAIKLDSSGPIFYEQVRTSAFGGRLFVKKFRTMVPESEDPTPRDDAENDRITMVGRVLRKTHMDEIPQLWTVLRGEMSVVGPRAIWHEEERLLETTVDNWRVRWHVKPGLTGLAQINDVTSTAGQQKLDFDLEYIRNQSIFLDLKIVVTQIWRVIADVGELSLRGIRH